MSDIGKNLKQIQQRIDQSPRKTGDTSTITLIAVSKKKPGTDIRAAFASGQTDFGENYLQEALEKQQELADLPLTWHFIGPIQSNKTRAIAENFHWVHSVDRLKIARRLAEQRPDQLPPLNICLQVNIDNEASKSGLHADEVADVIHTISSLDNINLRGLMAIPQPRDDMTPAFRKVAELFHAMKRQFSLPQWDTLSMGMSADLEQAIAEGANMIRVGTDIFGARPQ